MSRAALCILCICLLFASALAGRPSRDPVARCIAKNKCASKKFKPVCAENVVASPGTFGGFPNKCYMNCANKAAGFGVEWVADHYYRVPRVCKTKWLAYPEECSTCHGY